MDCRPEMQLAGFPPCTIGQKSRQMNSVTRPERILHIPRYNKSKVEFATLDIKHELQALGKALNRPNFLKQAGLGTIERLISICQAYPEIGAAVDQFHGIDTLQGCVKSAAAADRRRRTNSVLDNEFAPVRRVLTGSVLDTPSVQHPIKTGELKVYNYDLTVNTARPEALSDEEAEKLRKDLVLIKDDRQEISVPVTVAVEKKLENPADSGIYWVLVKEGKFEKCFVAIHPQGACATNPLPRWCGSTARPTGSTSQPAKSGSAPASMTKRWPTGTRACPAPTPCPRVTRATC